MKLDFEIILNLSRCKSKSYIFIRLNSRKCNINYVYLHHFVYQMSRNERIIKNKPVSFSTPLTSFVPVFSDLLETLISS